MTLIATAQQSSTSEPAAFFARWKDHATWAEWSPDTEWVRVDGEAAQGVNGVLKPTGGPQVRFVISTFDPPREYTDTSSFPGAALVFRHLATPVKTGSKLDVTVSLTGPLAWLWKLILGKGFRHSVPADLARLVALVESTS